MHVDISYRDWEKSRQWMNEWLNEWINKAATSRRNQSRGFPACRRKLRSHSEKWWMNVFKLTSHWRLICFKITEHWHVNGDLLSKLMHYIFVCSAEIHALQSKATWQKKRSGFSKVTLDVNFWIRQLKSFFFPPRLFLVHYSWTNEPVYNDMTHKF